MGGTKRTELLESYIRGAWFVKIRLISSRRQLWASERSIIHLENAALQLRKICEMVSYLCIAAAGIEDFTVPRSVKGYQVGNVIKHLNRNGKLLFPSVARLIKNEDPDCSADWTLNVESANQADWERLEAIHERTHRVLHEMSPFIYLPTPEECKASIDISRNAIRADHQWLWNRLWQHSISLDGTIFFVNFGEDFNSDRPQIMKDKKFHQGELIVNFDPDVLADFSGHVNWDDYDH